MKLSRFAALLLSAALTLSLALPVRAADGGKLAGASHPEGRGLYRHGGHHL